jgi:UDP-N-acetylglucosamine--N-acetylmuramyl-(pentapeptide) pyrophosphoryl-undecaprenol N-acetylglucosamine transferase
VRNVHRFALVAGGGTGGHVIPALAVAGAIAEKRGPGTVELVGSRRGLDSELVRGSGMPVTLLPGRGLHRSARPRALAENVWAWLELGAAFVGAVTLVVRRRPDVVVAIGGYASVACSVAAKLLGVPVVLLNVDAVPGAANRFVSRFATVAAVAFDGTALPRAVVTGAPVRGEIREAARPDDADRAAARARLGIPPGRRVFGVVGGSLGARRLNEATLGLARMWASRTDVALYHVVGRRDYKWASDAAPDLPPSALWYRQVEYEPIMANFYQAADVVVSRSGANAVAELAVMGLPSILVPLPNAPGAHQSANAALLEAAGASIVVEDDECDANHLASDLDALAGDEARLRSMGEAASKVGRPDALDLVAQLVERNAREARSR